MGLLQIAMVRKFVWKERDKREVIHGLWWAHLLQMHSKHSIFSVHNANITLIILFFFLSCLVRTLKLRPHANYDLIFFIILFVLTSSLYSDVFICVDFTDNFSSSFTLIRLTIFTFVSRWSDPHNLCYFRWPT